MQRTGTNLLLGAGLVVMWSSGFIGAELSARAAPANTLLAWRFLVISAVLIAWAHWRHRPLTRPSRAGWRWLGAHTAIGALAQAGFLYGVFAAARHGVPAGTSALIASLQPIVGAAVAAPLLGERTGPRQAAGLGLGIAGVAVVVSSDLAVKPSVPWWAYALPLGAMLSLLTGSVLERRLRPGGRLLDVLTVQCGVSAALLTPIAAATGTLAPPADPLFWFAVAWVVLLSTVGGYGFYWAVLARGGVTRVSALLYLTPPTTTLWAWVMFGRPVTATSLVGLSLAAVAVGLIHYTRRPGDPPARHPNVTSRSRDIAHRCRSHPLRSSRRNGDTARAWRDGEWAYERDGRWRSAPPSPPSGH